MLFENVISKFYVWWEKKKSWFTKSFALKMNGNEVQNNIFKMCFLTKTIAKEVGSKPTFSRVGFKNSAEVIIVFFFGWKLEMDQKSLLVAIRRWLGVAKWELVKTHSNCEASSILTPRSSVILFIIYFFYLFLLLLLLFFFSYRLPF